MPGPEQNLKSLSTFKSLFIKWGQRGVFSVLCSVLCLLFLSGVVHSRGLVVMAKKISADMPIDADNNLWNGASAIEIPLAPQVMAKPRIYESTIKTLKVRAVHNTKEIAFLVE